MNTHKGLKEELICESGEKSYWRHLDVEEVLAELEACTINVYITFGVAEIDRGPLSRA